MAKAARRRPMSDINVVPYIDVMLVLLVIFMVTAPLMTQGIRVDLPTANSEAIAVDEIQQVLVVSINEQGEYFLNLGGEETPVALSLLAEQVAKIKAANSNLQVLVEGDASIAYGSVIELMDLLQKIGIADVGLVTQP
ncbi:MAG: protein TolR, partial [Pseudomonadales bacterium]